MSDLELGIGLYFFVMWMIGIAVVSNIVRKERAEEQAKKEKAEFEARERQRQYEERQREREKAIDEIDNVSPAPDSPAVVQDPDDAAIERSLGQVQDLADDVAQLARTWARS